MHHSKSSMLYPKIAMLHLKTILRDYNCLMFWFNMALLHPKLTLSHLKTVLLSMNLTLSQVKRVL